MAANALFRLVIKHKSLTMGDMKDGIRGLLSEGFDINMGSDGDSHNALEVAIEERVPWLAEFLLLQRADPNRRNWLHITPMHDIAEYVRDPRLLQVCIDHGGLVDAKNNSGETPLFLAVMSEWADGMKILLENGADPFVVNSDGMTILHQACQTWCESVECLQVLLDLGVLDINKKDLDANSALHLALLNEDMDTDIQLQFVRMLTADGADLTAKNNDGLTAQDITSIFIGVKGAVGSVQERHEDSDHLHLLHDYLENELKVRNERNEAVLMALHPRLGNSSRMSVLSPDEIRMILTKLAQNAHLS